MGKKKVQRHSWGQAKNLCRLNQNDVAMAKALGFGPDALIRARPDPKQKWKLPVKYWIHELHYKRFGRVLGEEPLPVRPLVEPEYTEEDARRFEEQQYWEDYYERNKEDLAAARKSGKRKEAGTGLPPPDWKSVQEFLDDDSANDDRDVPF